MPIVFNADEVFEMAEQIERNGAKFYRQAAQKAGDSTLKTMFNDLAAMEEGHEKTFAQMRKELGAEDKEPTTFDPDNQVALYLRTMADFHGTEGKAGPNEFFTGKETLEDVLKTALQAEKNSIAFYVGIRDLVPSKSAKEKVHKIIIEEMAHVSTLGAKLQALR